MVLSVNAPQIGVKGLQRKLFEATQGEKKSPIVLKQDSITFDAKLASPKGDVLKAEAFVKQVLPDVTPAELEGIETLFANSCEKLGVNGASIATLSSKDRLAVVGDMVKALKSPALSEKSTIGNDISFTGKEDKKKKSAPFPINIFNNLNLRQKIVTISFLAYLIMPVDLIPGEPLPIAYIDDGLIGTGLTAVELVLNSYNSVKKKRTGQEDERITEILQGVRGAQELAGGFRKDPRRNGAKQLIEGFGQIDTKASKGEIAQQLAKTYLNKESLQQGLGTVSYIAEAWNAAESRVTGQPCEISQRIGEDAEIFNELVDEIANNPRFMELNNRLDQMKDRYKEENGMT